jgi:hypothetical protein
LDILGLSLDAIFVRIYSPSSKLGRNLSPDGVVCHRPRHCLDMDVAEQPDGSPQEAWHFAAHYTKRRAWVGENSHDKDPVENDEY